MHHWLSLFDWAPVGAAMLLWAVLIALVGYAAAFAAWRRHP